MRNRVWPLLLLLVTALPAALSAQETPLPPAEDSKPTLQQRLMPENTAKLLAPAPATAVTEAETAQPLMMQGRGSGVGLMIAGGALFVAGLIVGNDAGTVLAVSLPGVLEAAVPQERTPSTNPATQRDARGRDQDEQGDGRRGGGQDRGESDRGGEGRGPQGGPGSRGMFQEPTEEEWQEALAFLRENSPNRLELYEEAVQQWRREQAQNPEAEVPRTIRGVRARIFGRIRLLRMVEDRDPPLYALALQQFRLEDEIIGSLHAAREARLAGDAAGTAQAMEKAQEAVRKYAMGTLEEREARLQRMREELSREEQRLEQDREQMDKLVERLLERFQRSVPGSREDQERPPEGERREGGGG